MSTYKEQQAKRKSYVLLKDCEVLGVFGNLKKVCEFLKDEDFYSYNTLVRKELPVEQNGYKLDRVKHH